MAESPLKLFVSVSRLHIIAIAAMGTFTFGWLFTGHYPIALCGICALDWFLVNLLNRVVDVREDRKNAIVGTDWVSRNRRPILVAGFALLISSLIAIHLVFPLLTRFRLAYHALGLTYNWPLLPGGRRIKQLYFWKNTASATGFILTVFCYPLAQANVFSPGDDTIITLAKGVTVATIGFSALFFFLFELSYEVIYDLRDAPGDAEARVLTYPVVHGIAGAVRITDGLLYGSMATLIAGYALHALPWRIFIMICAPLFQLIIYKRWLKRGIRPNDCIKLTWFGVALLATYHLWIWAGLPGA